MIEISSYHTGSQIAQAVNNGPDEECAYFIQEFFPADNEGTNEDTARIILDHLSDDQIQGIAHAMQVIVDKLMEET